MRQALAGLLAALLAHPGWAANTGSQARVPALGNIAAPMQGAAVPQGALGGLAIPVLPGSLSAPGAKDEDGQAEAPKYLGASEQARAAAPQAQTAAPAPAAAKAVSGAPGLGSGLATAFVRAGLPESNAGRLAALWEQRLPAAGQGFYHDQDQGATVVALAESLMESYPQWTPKQRATVLLAAAFHAADPKRHGPEIPIAARAAEAFEDAGVATALLGTEVSASEVAALIRGLEIGPSGDAARRALGDHFAPDQHPWAVEASLLAGFARRIAPFSGEPIRTVERLRALAAETRATAYAATGIAGANPSDEAFVKAGFTMLSPLKHSKFYALLPDGARSGFELGLSTLEFAHRDAYFKLDKSASSRGPPVYSMDAPSALERAQERAELLSEPSEKVLAADVAAAMRYVRGIAGTMKLTEKQAVALIETFLEENEIPRDSARARAILAKMVPAQQQRERRAMLGLDPRLAEHASLIMEAAQNHGTTPAGIEKALKAHGYLEAFLAPLPRENRLATISRAVLKSELALATAKYPDNEQGNLLREAGATLAAPGGKSIEEIKRDGVFLYVNFAGQAITKASIGRDPDPTYPDMLFYVRFENGRWRIGGYRQNYSKRFKTGTADHVYEARVREWLLRGGIPAEHLEP